MTGPTQPPSPDFLLVYEELRRLAGAYLRRERGNHTLQPTALVNEAWLRIERSGSTTVDRQHFLAVAARVMRHILVDYARSRSAERRGGGQRPVPLDKAGEIPLGNEEYLIALDESLGRLAARDPRAARVVELRFFGGLSVEETATTMDVSTSTVDRDWAFARSWLHRDIRAGDEK